MAYHKLRQPKYEAAGPKNEAGEAEDGNRAGRQKRAKLIRSPPSLGRGVLGSWRAEDCRAEGGWRTARLRRPRKATGLGGKNRRS